MVLKVVKLSVKSGILSIIWVKVGISKTIRDRDTLISVGKRRGMIKIQIREMNQKTSIPGTIRATKQDGSTKTHRRVITRLSQHHQGNKIVVIHVLVLNNLFNTPRSTNTWLLPRLWPYVGHGPGWVIPGGWTVVYGGFKQDTGWEGGNRVIIL